MSRSHPPKKPAAPQPAPDADVLGVNDFDFSYLETADMEELLSADLRAVFERMAEASTGDQPKTPQAKQPSAKRRKSA